MSHTRQNISSEESNLPYVEHVEFAEMVHLEDIDSLQAPSVNEHELYQLPPSERLSTPPYPREAFAWQAVQPRRLQHMEPEVWMPHLPPLQLPSDTRDFMTITAQPVRPVNPHDHVEFAAASTSPSEEQSVASSHQRSGDVPISGGSNTTRHPRGHPKVLAMIHNDYGIPSHLFDYLDNFYREKDDRENAERGTTAPNNRHVDHQPNIPYSYEPRSPRQNRYAAL